MRQTEKIVGSVLLSGLLSLVSLNTNGQTLKTAKLKVYGNCEHCQERIETTLDVKGVRQYRWTPKTHIATITYDSTVITLKQLSGKLAQAGHDTELDTADQNAYDKLPKCCHYTRVGHR